MSQAVDRPIENYFQWTLVLTQRLNRELANIIEDFANRVDPFPIQDLVNAISDQVSVPKIYYFRKGTEYFVKEFGFCYERTFNPIDCTGGNMIVGPLLNMQRPNVRLISRNDFMLYLDENNN